MLSSERKRYFVARAFQLLEEIAAEGITGADDSAEDVLFDLTNELGLNDWPDAIAKFADDIENQESARRKALEEAAATCDHLIQAWRLGDGSIAATLRGCAEAIRALMEKPE
jgi:hypothetical protein